MPWHLIFLTWISSRGWSSSARYSFSLIFEKTLTDLTFDDPLPSTFILILVMVAELLMLASFSADSLAVAAQVLDPPPVAT
jgi:hypothetical protein